jgi:hypothetical protein
MKRATQLISCFDAEGLPVQPPVILDLYTTYFFRVETVNLSKTTGGEPWPELLEVGTQLSLDGAEVVPWTTHVRQFAPDGAAESILKLDTLAGYGGMKGVVVAKCFDPFGGQLAQASLPFSVGFEVSPLASLVKVSRENPRGIMPTLSPDLDLGPIVFLGGGKSKSHEKPPPPVPPKHTPAQGGGIDASPPKRRPKPDPGEGRNVIIGGELF